MGKKKSKTPAPPPVLPPVGVATPWGNATYDGSNYNFSAQDFGEQNNYELANKLFTNSLAQVQNPDQAIQHAQDVYRQLMMPQYEQERERSLGETQAGLGNRYFSTFGQLTNDKAVENQAVSRGQLESDIYNQGQTMYDTLLQRAGVAQGMANTAQDQYLKPYTTLAQMAGTMGPNINSPNTANAANYQSQLGLQAAKYHANASSGGNGLMAASTLAGAVLPSILKAAIP